MKVVQKGKEDNYKEFYPNEYEFKLCGGSVEPKDRIVHPSGDDKKETEEAR